MKCSGSLRLMPGLSAVLLVGLAACGGDESDPTPPSYETPTPPPDTGALFEAAGTYALKTTMSQYVENILTLKDGDFELQTVESYKIVTIEPSGSSLVYSEKLCITYLSETNGSDTALLPGFYENDQPIPYSDVKVDAEIGGAFSLPSHIELRGINLDNPATDALPTEETYESDSALAAKVYDFDGDGNPGFTVTVDGFLDGDLYAVERLTIAYDGTIYDADSISGYITGVIEDSFIHSTSGAIPTDTEVKPDTEKDHNFFQLKRKDPSYTCTNLSSDLDKAF